VAQNRVFRVMMFFRPLSPKTSFPSFDDGLVLIANLRICADDDSVVWLLQKNSVVVVVVSRWHTPPENNVVVAVSGWHAPPLFLHDAAVPQSSRSNVLSTQIQLTNRLTIG
jgi:hypothetical protein